MGDAVKLFIFGAGASQASQASHGISLIAPSKPPLVDELFNESYLEWSGQLDFPASEIIRDYPKNSSLEEWLTERWEHLSTLTYDRDKQGMNSYFGNLAFHVWWVLTNVSGQTGGNLYGKFLKRLRDKNDQFDIINFNYDTLLDVEFEKIQGVNLDSLSNYFEYRYFKPHGSVNWFLPPREKDPRFIKEMNLDVSVRFRYAANNMFSNGPLNLDDIIVYPPSHSDYKRKDFITSSIFGNRFFYPLIFLPLTVKMYDFVKNFESKMMEMCQSSVKGAKEIYFIGYKAKDVIIKDLLRHAQAETVVHVVNPEAEDIMRNVLQINSGLVRGKMEKGFGEFVEAC